MMRTALHISAWLALAAIVFVTVAPIGFRPGDLLPVNVDRAVASGALAALFTLAYPKHWVKVGLIMIAGAAGIELLQLLSPTRHARIDDALIKGLGALIGVVVAVVANFTFARLKIPQATTGKPLQVGNSPSLTDIVAAFNQNKELPLRSQMIKSIQFSPTDGTLRVTFRSGAERAFEEVPAKTAVDMIQASSPGQYYLDKVRHKYRRRAA